MIPDMYNPRPSGADPLIEGYYLIDLKRSGRIDIPVRVWFGEPLDPVTLEPMDRRSRWQIQIGFIVWNGEPLDFAGIRIEHLSDIWPTILKNKITWEDWSFRLERSEWAGENDETDPFSQLGSKVDPMTCALP